MLTNTEWANLRDALLTRQLELTSASPKSDEIRIEREADELDGALRAADRELALHQLTRESRENREIMSALARMDNAAYGLCVCCEEEIGVKRLRAIPWAALCIRCQEATDRGEQAYCPDLSGKPRSQSNGTLQTREAA